MTSLAHWHQQKKLTANKHQTMYRRLQRAKKRARRRLMGRDLIWDPPIALARNPRSLRLATEHDSKLPSPGRPSLSGPLWARRAPSGDVSAVVVLALALQWTSG